ncbi:uncharacterized protein LOC118191227 [Stegodyphus dumicola]|uniref:uncharacterized protein LOC118191227 n=1 Tax=Stegodyphus dumicola TaxID=202533 RepID=UPI0015A9E9B2|nr:uncharacterized protein LOC118191227 [Stegodyphus dumicola]XP_035217920.1 uncharacterized protein LOC118191227 [Stegodyphus dumicola]XP_035217922.1 uncharacterized protein LOC118191227 [Stegodyphus dumicola]
MCKHKSGGMSKPSGATSQGGLTERTTASFSSHNCPQNASGASSSQVSSATSVNTDSSYNSQMRNFTVVPAASNSNAESCNISCDTHIFLPNDEAQQCSGGKKYENISFIPNVQEVDCHDYGESDEDDTEQSPMLMKETCGMYCTPAETWTPNMLSEMEFNKDILKPKHFNPCDPYPHSNTERRDRNKAMNCDNFSSYHNFQPQSTFQEPISYLSTQRGAMACSNYFENAISDYDDSQAADLSDYTYATKSKKWFLNQKCKSADSEPDSFAGRIPAICSQAMPAISYTYVQDQSTNIPRPLMSDSNNYLKPTYVNGIDPVAGPSGIQRPSSINWEIGTNNRDGEFRSRSYSLTPTVNFAVFESESSSEAEDVQEPTISQPADVPMSNELSIKTMDDPFELSMMSLGKVIPISPSAAQLSIASSYGENGSPICKICHMTARENDPLISPCRCSGTMQYIHCGCLMRWLEVCHKRGRRPASCELCQYQYHWHKKFKVRHWKLPPCSRKDKVLHLLFFLAVLLMVTCASITVLCFKQDNGTKIDPNRTELTHSEIVTLVCGVLFFLAFFIAMYVEVKSHDTLYQLLVKFIHINQQWYIDEYEKKETAPVAV